MMTGTEKKELVMGVWLNILLVAEQLKLDIEHKYAHNSCVRATSAYLQSIKQPMRCSCQQKTGFDVNLFILN